SVSWLKGQQQADGSIGGVSGGFAPNSNTTGLAAWALGEQGECVAAGRAGAWVLKLQVPHLPVGNILADDRGAIAYDSADLAAAQAGGIATEKLITWKSATAQAGPGLV